MTAKSIAEAVRNVADYVEKKSGWGVFDIVPGIHQKADRERQVTWDAQQKAAGEALRAFATRSETDPVTIAAFRALLEGLPVPDIVRLPAEWAIYDRYGA